MMTKKKKIVIIVGIVVILLAGIVVLWKLSPAERKKSRLRHAAKIMGEMWNKAVSLQSRSKFTISGKIVDDAGQPVDQVKIRISQTYLTNFGTSESDRDSQQTVNSDFNLELSGGSEVSLGFHKDGYYDILNKHYPLPKSTTAWGFSSNVVAADNQLIVMERIGTLAKYKGRSHAFFIREENFFTCYSIPLLKRDESKKYSFADIPNLPPGTIYPNVERDEDGKIIKVVINKASGRLGPQTVSLNMVGGDDDGFIMLKGLPQRGLISIKEAPESGYVKQMVFHFPEDMQKKIYFYYKFGNRYGKGVADNFGCTAGGEIMIGSDLYQNTETSSDLQVRRNLRTRQ